MKKFKRILASLLVLCMMVGLVPVSAMPVEAAEDSIVVIAGSDYQASGASGTMQTIMNQIKNKYETAYGALLGGDYDGGDTETTAADIEAVDDDIDVVFPEITAEHRIYLQGNHESWSNLEPSDSNLMNETGAYDTDYYGVYAINHKDYPWSYSNPTASLVQSTAAGLDAYLDAKVEEGYEKPIFVMSHLPLHYSTRTSSSGDGQYAKYLYDVLDEAGNKGLNIIFLFGHNHSSTYDDYLGGGQIYLKEGDSICVAEEGSKTNYFTDTLSFTYMNYGYVGEIKGNAGTNLSMTSFEITDGQVAVNRYGTSGTVELKAKGVTTSGAPTADTSTVASGAVIELNQFEPDAALTGITVTAPDKLDYVIADTLDTTGMEVIASYDDGSTMKVTGYDISADLTSAGTKTVTVTYKEQKATFEINVYAPVTDETTGITVSAPGITGLSVTKITEEIPADSGYGAYVSYDITPIGDFSGTATVTVPVSDSFDAGKPVKILDDDTVMATTTIKNNTVTFTTNHFSVYALAQDAESVLEWKEIPGGTTYTLTDTLTAGEEYLIVSSNSAGNGYALQNPGTTSNVAMGDSKVEIQSGTTPTILTEDTDIVWSATQSGSVIKLTNNGDYLEGKSGKVRIHTTSQYPDRGWEYEDLQLKYTGGSNTYVVYYSNGFTYTHNSTSSKVYLYEKTGTSNGGYAAMTGTTVYNVITNTTTVENLETQIRENLIVYTASDADGTDEKMTEDYTLSGNVDPTVAGEYAYTVTYGGVTLGTITVNVVDKEIDEIVLSDNSGSVNKGASSAAETGASLTIKYKDGTSSDPIPVTVGMLTDAEGNKVSTSTIGTITDLYVNYNGQKFSFTLTVNPKEGNNYPNYPDPGAVKVNKTATGIDFQASGVATVELSASGIPMNEGVDVVIILDTSNSMTSNNKYPDENGTEMYRIELLRPAVNNLIQQLKTKREDGTNPDIDIAIATFNGNTITEKTNYIGGTGSRGTNYGIKTGDGTIAGAWEKITDISSTWATDNDNENTPTASGTNYDYGLQIAYDLLAQKKADSQNERLQFVLFLSDGAPSQYNGVESNDGQTEYVKWLMANYDETDESTDNDIPDTVSDKNKTFYTGYTGSGQVHRSAEAIKASVGETYNVIDFDTDATGELKEVDGLGATIYTIGLLLEDYYSGSTLVRDEDDLITVLKTIASDEDTFFNIDSVNDLSGAFSSFAQDVLLAATNARFEDQMGQMYDLQLTPVDYLPTDETENYSTINPTIEVRSYEIWTRAEYEAGTITDQDLIGTRKTNEDGSYKYTTLEIVEFQYNKNDTNDYTLTGATSDQLESTNILSDGVICGKYFYYNTTAEEKTVDGITVGAETFYWKLGDIKTTELAIRYNVSLTGAIEGNREAGSYDTNQSAILYYDNYLGNPCKKEAISPTMAWEGAVVRYAFYLVDASSGKPVNNEGVEVPFSNRTIIVNPTDYANINLFSSDAVESKQIVADHVLPEGYWLYDESASYDITVRGNGTGEWSITGDDTLNNPNSTYVTGYDGDKYTYENSENVIGHDYTHTTVWFAVKWEPQPIDDTVVIDYGIPVDVHVLTNDMFGKYGKLIGVTEGDVTETASKTENEVTTTSANGEFGTAVVNVPTTGYTDENSVIRYALSKDTGMQMTEPEIFTYSVQYANPIESKNDGTYYGNLTVIPATTVYYEDDFVEYSSYTWDAEKDDWTTRDESLWSEVTDDTYVDEKVITQDEDRPGNIKYAFDTVIDANNVYGYDSHYTECSEYSLGSAMKATVDYDNYAQAEFSFYGTGFDVVSLTSNQTGTILVYVYDENGKAVRSHIVDTYYGYTFESKDMNGDNSISAGEGEWVISENNPNALYQVPVVEIAGLTYGKYNVEIQAMYDPGFDHNDTDATFDFYLDAIRIYDPANDGLADGTTDTTIEDAYVEDHEAWPVYKELRNNVIDAAVYNSESGETEIDGIVFIDSDDATASVADYESYGPNNELYLAPDQAIAFNLDLSAYVDENGKSIVDTVQLGMKSADGKTISYKVFDAATVKDSTGFDAIDSEKLETSTGMYYDISNFKDKTIVIYNDGSEGILSLTDVKVTFTQDPGEVENLFVVSTASIKKIVENMNKEPETSFTPTVTISTSPTKIYVGNKITVKVTTDAEVESVSIDGKLISSYSKDKSGKKIWTSKVPTSVAGEQTVSVVAYNKDGVASTPIEKKITVSAVNSVGSAIGSIVNTLFGWLFG